MQALERLPCKRFQGSQRCRAIHCRVKVETHVWSSPTRERPAQNLDAKFSNCQAGEVSEHLPRVGKFDYDGRCALCLTYKSNPLSRLKNSAVCKRIKRFPVHGFWVEQLTFH